MAVGIWVMVDWRLCFLVVWVVTVEEGGNSTSFRSVEKENIIEKNPSAAEGKNHLKRQQSSDTMKIFGVKNSCISQ